MWPCLLMIKERLSQDFSLAYHRLNILRGTWIPNTLKHENEDIAAVLSKCAEKVCFRLAMENDVEGTWKIRKENLKISRNEVFYGSVVTVVSHILGHRWEVTCYCVDSLLLTCELPIYLPGSNSHEYWEKWHHLCNTEPNGPLNNTPHMHEMIRFRTAA